MASAFIKRCLKTTVRDLLPRLTPPYDCPLHHKYGGGGGTREECNNNKANVEVIGDKTKGKYRRCQVTLVTNECRNTSSGDIYCRNVHVIKLAETFGIPAFLLTTCARTACVSIQGNK